MTRKKNDPTPSNANTMKVQAEPGESREAVMARLAVEPCMTAAAVATAFSEAFGEVDFTGTHAALLDKTKRVHDGNMREVESTLVAQSAALNSIFTSLARRAANQEYLHNYEVFMKLALRAQNQARMTLETLATIKNPPVVFAKQANIAHGHQQVNNGEAVSVARAGESERPQPELLEAPHAKPEWMDAGAARAAAPSDPAMATVEAIDRTANAGRQGKVKP